MKLSKFLIIFSIIFIIIFLSFTTIVNATGSAEFNWGTTINSVSALTGDSNLNNSANTIVGSILSVVRIVAAGIAIIMLLIVAMKYMIASPGDRAEIKKHAVVYVVGAVVLFASTGILGIIQKFASQIK